MSRPTSSPQPAANASPSARLSRRALLRSIVAACVVAGGVVTVRMLEAAMHATFDKPPAPLSKPLPLMSRTLGSPVRYIAQKPDEVMDKEMVETLGTSDYLVRQYTDTSLNAGEPGACLNLNVNYYATGSSTPHVPEVCWAGAGREQAPDSPNEFQVNGVTRKDGTTVDLRMRLISFKPGPGESATAPDGEPQYSNVAYVFQVNGNYVSNPQEVMSQFWKASYPYAYHCKIEITPLDASDPRGQKVLTCTQARAKQIVSDFIRYALPAVEECLPDPSILNRSSTTAAESEKKR